MLSLAGVGLWHAKQAQLDFIVCCSLFPTAHFPRPTCIPITYWSHKPLSVGLTWSGCRASFLKSLHRSNTSFHSLLKHPLASMPSFHTSNPCELSCLASVPKSTGFSHTHPSSYTSQGSPRPMTVKTEPDVLEKMGVWMSCQCLVDLRQEEPRKRAQFW